MSGQAWKYSDQLDDMDLKMMKRDFFTYKIGMENIMIELLEEWKKKQGEK